MGKLSLTRRSFVKVSAAVSAAAFLTGGTQSKALAEETQPASADDIQVIRTACRGCGKFECGVFVTVKNGRAIQIEGDDTYPGSMGNCCSKSQASIQACYHPDRLRYPMKRTNPKGEDPGWVRVSWDEAIELGAAKLGELKEKYGGASLGFFGGTSRIYAMSGMSAMAYLYDSPNAVSPGQVCKGPRNAVTQNTSHREFAFVENIWRQPVFVQWGSGIEVSNYDDAGRVAVDNAAHADTYINIDARMSNLAKEADYFLGVRPGTDAAIALAWTKLAIEKEAYDELYVKRWTNASFLVCEEMEPSGWDEDIVTVGLVGAVPGKRSVKTVLLKESDIKEDGDPKKFIVWDAGNKKFTYLDAGTGLWEGETFATKYTDQEYLEWSGLWEEGKYEKAEGEYIESGRPGISPTFLPESSHFQNGMDPSLWSDGGFDITLKDGRAVKCRTVWEHYYDNCVEFSPEKAEEVTGVKADLIEEAFTAWAKPNDLGYGNGALNYSVTHEHTGNALKLIHSMEALDAIMGNIDTPGGHRGITRAPSNLKDQTTRILGQFLRVGSKNKVTDPDQAKKKICSAPFQGGADATEFYHACVTGEPFPVYGGFAQAAGILNQTNILEAWEAVKQMDFFVDLNLWHEPASDLADLLLPENHWLEVECTRIAQGSAGYYGAHIQCVEPIGETRWGIDIVGDWYKASGEKFWEDKDNPGGGSWDMGDVLRDKAVASTGMTWQEYRTKFLEEGWFDARKTNPDGFGSCRRYETGWLRQPFDGKPGFGTNTSRHELWSTNFEERMRKQTEQATGELFGTKFALPYYVEPKSSPKDDAFRTTQMNNPDYPNAEKLKDYTPENYPFALSTGRRIPVYFHSEHRQLPWCREQWLVPRLEMNPSDAERLGLQQGDWAWIETPFGKIRQCVDLFAGVAPGCANAEHSWWFPELDQPGHGFQLSGCNCLVDSWAKCEGVGAPHLRGYLANIYKATPDNSPFGNPVPCGDDGTEIIHTPGDPRLKEWANLVYEIKE